VGPLFVYTSLLIARAFCAFCRSLRLFGFHMKAKVALFFPVDHIAQALMNAVVLVKGQHYGFTAVQILWAVHVFVSADDDFIPTLTGPGRRTVEYAAARPRLAVDDVGGNTLSVALVPDIHKFQRVDARLAALLRVKRHRAVVVQFAPGNTNAMQFCPQYLQHDKLSCAVERA